MGSSFFIPSAAYSDADLTDSDDEYQKLIKNMNLPRVVIDNEASPSATIIDSGNKRGILLEAIQVLIDLKLVITKAYVTSDGGWFMDVFNVTDQDGKKLNDEATVDTLENIRKSLGADSYYIPSKRRSVGVGPSTDHTVIELTGTDRQGLLSEVSAVLAELKCNVVDAEIWTHNARVAAVMHVTDVDTGLAITDTARIFKIKERLHKLLEGNNISRGAKTVVSVDVTHRERRLHQLMFDDRDFENPDQDLAEEGPRPKVTILDCNDKDYSVVTIRCRDRPKLLFDTVCALTDMQYVVFHANVGAEESEAYQEFYIRKIDGSSVNSSTEKERLVQCLEAAIQRRVSEGVKLELCTSDRVGLLSEVTRIFREHSLTVTRAEVATREGKAIKTFYVRDYSGNSVDAKTIATIEKVLGQTVFQVRGQKKKATSPNKRSPIWFLFGFLLRASSFV
ncbi:ACT domain-containing protein ACR4 isoform X2 [Typha angustifolia]|uniref:ACT domain-containing protein ACR4 isoform X2 n=1 Tax=Typha angustifolia TaxID=59011 RepID=UPI003C30C728